VKICCATALMARASRIKHCAIIATLSAIWGAILGGSRSLGHPGHPLMHDRLHASSMGTTHPLLPPPAAGPNACSWLRRHRRVHRWRCAAQLRLLRRSQHDGLLWVGGVW
jgi:hypothetical protein